MSVNYAILGLLRAKPMSGYDLKKAIQSAPYLPWSGNNNQVYRALSQLCSENLLAGDTLHQDGAPTKKIYHITPRGEAALEQWICATAPEAPDIHNPFLVQLATVRGSEPEVVRELLEQYREAVNNQLILQRENRRRKREAADSAQGSQWIEDMVFDNILRFYQAQLDWTDGALRGVQAAGKDEIE